MKPLTLAVAVALAAGTATTFAATMPAVSAAPAHEVPVVAAHGQAIPEQYIVTVKGADARSVAAAAHVTPKYVYDTVLNGFAAKMTAAQVDALRHNPNVATIEQDAVAHIDSTQSSAPWGLDRIDQRNLPLSGTYTYSGSGSGVNAYIIDTGIYTSDSDFGGRAHVAHDSIGGNGIDCNGHGTHVAGTVGGAKYGVAKSVTLWAVRVLDCNGSGAYSSVIDGMNWVASNHGSKAVANMSLGGGYSADVNNAATNLANSGVFLAVAAGNSGADACNYSPSSAYGTTTVAASDSSDTRASWSNYGGCVDVYAPGVNITSDWLNGGTNTISGTSMATPHVTGVGALYKGDYGDASWSTVRNWIINNGTSGVIKSNPSGTPNLLLYKAGL